MESGQDILFRGSWEDFYVKEDWQCLKVVSAMAERVEMWDKFDPVDLIFWEGKYFVNCEGNHTSLAHYFLDAPMRATVWMHEDSSTFDPEMYFPIGDVWFDRFCADMGDEHAERMKDALFYFPEKRAREFCLENGLDVDRFYLGRGGVTGSLLCDNCS